MKKSLIILLSAILVTASAVTGVFADSSDTMVVFEGGTDNPEFSQVIAGPFAQFNFTSEFLSSHLDERIPLFNGIEMLVGNSSDNPTYVRVSFFVENETPDYATSLYLIDYGGYYPVCFKATAGGSLSVSRRLPQYASSSDWQDLIRGAGYLTVSQLYPAVTVGSSIEYSSSSVVGEVFDFTLPAGYALVIQGECEILERNFSISNSWNFTNSDGNRVNGSSERLLAFGNVVDGFSPDRNLARSSLIQWQALNSNIQGSASNYSFSANDLVTVPSGACFVISYPTLYGYGSAYPANATISYENSVDLTGNVYLQYSGDRPTIRVVALESLSEYSSSGQFSTYSVFRPAVKNEVLTPSGVSDDGHTVLTPSSPLPSGGGNAGQPPVDEDNGFLGTISNFLNDIKNLLSTGSHAVVELVTYGASFMSAIASMYNWLPATLSTLIITAFTVVLVIGVIKLLWK